MSFVNQDGVDSQLYEAKEISFSSLVILESIASAVTRRCFDLILQKVFHVPYSSVLKCRKRAFSRANNFWQVHATYVVQKLSFLASVINFQWWLVYIGVVVVAIPDSMYIFEQTAVKIVYATSILTFSNDEFINEMSFGIWSYKQQERKRIEIQCDGN